MTELINKLRNITKTALDNELKEKPLKLRNQIVEKIEEVAKSGYYETNWSFASEREPVYYRVINYLKDDGFKVSRIDNQTILISWR